jgi:hypothetical protein
MGEGCIVQGRRGVDEVNDRAFHDDRYRKLIPVDTRSPWTSVWRGQQQKTVMLSATGVDCRGGSRGDCGRVGEEILSFLSISCFRNSEEVVDGEEVQDFICFFWYESLDVQEAKAEVV